jgi:hypothetical protein
MAEGVKRGSTLHFGSVFGGSSTGFPNEFPIQNFFCNVCIWNSRIDMNRPLIIQDKA